MEWPAGAHPASLSSNKDIKPLISSEIQQKTCITLRMAGKTLQLYPSILPLPSLPVFMLDLKLLSGLKMTAPEEKTMTSMSGEEEKKEIKPQKEFSGALKHHGLEVRLKSDSSSTSPRAAVTAAVLLRLESSLRGRSGRTSSSRSHFVTTELLRN